MPIRPLVNAVALLLGRLRGITGPTVNVPPSRPAGAAVLTCPSARAS